MKIVVPDFFDAERRMKAGNEDALDEFVYHNEPAGKEQEEKFRRQLQDLIDYVARQVTSQQKPSVGRETKHRHPISSE